MIKGKKYFFTKYQWERWKRVTKLLISQRKVKLNRLLRLNKIKRAKVAHLLFFRRFSNLFIVVRNFRKKHLITLTAGNCLLGKKKKEKMAVHNMIKLVNRLVQILKKYNYSYVYIQVRQRLNRYFFTLYNLLKKNQLYMVYFRYLLQRPHGVIKRKKVRRI